jgi:hypothetical protein
MATRVRYSLEFNQKTVEFLKTNKEASFEQVKEYVKTLGFDTISKNKFNDLRRDARGPAEAPKEYVVDLKTGRLLKNLQSARGGELVAIYELKRRGRIQVSIVDEK